RVLNTGISLALDKLVKEGKFYPFGVAMTRKGEIAVLTAPHLSVLRDALADGAHSGSYKAAAIVADFAFEKLPPNGGERDAIRIALESENGDAVTCYLPYTLVSPGGTRDVRPGQAFAQRSEPTIFA
ncbi:MAG: hypothetical protein ACREJX_16180, partial [Polyangiaceae bacterium]